MVKGYTPKTEQEALKLRADYLDSLLILGGTDVLVQKKQNDVVLCLNQVKDWSCIREEEKEDGSKILSIGAAMTYQRLLQENKMPTILKEAMIQVASPAIRSAGTITGNIGNASPAGDTLPVLYLLNASVVLSHWDKENEQILRRTIPIEQFILGVRKTQIKENEIISAIELPVIEDTKFTKMVFEKIGARRSEAIAKLSFAACYEKEDTKVKQIRFAFGSVATTVIREQEIEKSLQGLTIAQIKEKKEEILTYFKDKIVPIDDQRSTAIYRKQVCLNLLDYFLEGLK